MLERIRDHLKRLVSYVVSVGVVDFFEAVYVNERESKISLRGFEREEGNLQRLFYMAAVGNARQRVLIRGAFEFAEFLLHFLLFGVFVKGLDRADDFPALVAHSGGANRHGDSVSVFVV